MRYLFAILVITGMLSCQGTGKKDPRQAMDDTARMDPAPVTVSKIEPVKGSVKDLPAEIRLKGNLQELWTWKDKLGDNLLVLTRVEPFEDKEKNAYGEEGQTAELLAFLYVRQGGGAYRQVWMMSDGEKACPFDITCSFIPGAVTITDLDTDGLAETKLQYRLACRSDVSPSTMKLIMYEGEAKYALRGLSWFGMEGAVFDVTAQNANLEKLPGYTGAEADIVRTFGRYESEREFTGAPDSFLSHARQEWMKFVKENME